mgnify:FL=1
MYKTKEDVEEIIIIIESIKASFEKFAFWVLDTLHTPTPGVVCTVPIKDNRAREKK